MCCLFLSGAESRLLVLPGSLACHMATHLGIHSFLSKKLPSVPCLAPELPCKVESCSHSRHVGHAGEGSVQPSSSPPRDAGNPCPPRDKGNHCFPGHLGRFKLHLRSLQAWHGEAALVHKFDLCHSSACSRRSELPNTFFPLSCFHHIIICCSTAQAAALRCSNPPVMQDPY